MVVSVGGRAPILVLELAEAVVIFGKLRPLAQIVLLQIRLLLCHLLTVDLVTTQLKVLTLHENVRIILKWLAAAWSY